jgi:hypothetical protein
MASTVTLESFGLQIDADNDPIQFPDILGVESMAIQIDLPVFQEDATHVDYVQYGAGQGFFLGENYKIQPMQQPDAGISAATGWDTTTVLTYDELVQAAADSPAANNTGHIELYYYNNDSNSHNITIIEVNITNDTKKRIYSFNAI